LHTLYRTTQTKILRGILKKFMIVLLASSGTYWDLIFIMDGQNIPTQASKVQKPRNRMQPENDTPAALKFVGTTRNCSNDRSQKSSDIFI